MGQATIIVSSLLFWFLDPWVEPVVNMPQAVRVTSHCRFRRLHHYPPHSGYRADLGLEMRPKRLSDRRTHASS